MNKLFNKCHKLKEVLSANKEATLFVEGLIDGIDFRAPIKRSEFEELSQALLDSITKPIERILEIAQKKINDINVIEIIGGGVRIPKIQEILKAYSNGVEIGSHLNGDEAMALGAAFSAANNSLSFRVRPIWLNDGFNFDVMMTVRGLESDDNYHKSITLFPFKKRFGSKRVLSFTHN